MPKTNTLTAVPYDESGSMLSYANSQPGRSDSAAEWRPNDQFWATLRVLSYNAGRSARGWILASPNNPEDRRTWPIFASDLLSLMHDYPYPVLNATYSGVWKARKCGMDYGLYLVHPLLDPEAQG